MSYFNNIAWQVNYPDVSRIGERIRPLNTLDPVAITLRNGYSANIANLADAVVLAAPTDATMKIYVTKIFVTNGHATQGTWVVLKDGAAGAIIWKGYADAKGGFVVDLSGEPILLSLLNGLYAANLTNGADVVVCAAGYEGV